MLRTTEAAVPSSPPIPKLVTTIVVVVVVTTVSITNVTLCVFVFTHVYVYNELHLQLLLLTRSELGAPPPRQFAFGCACSRLCWPLAPWAAVDILVRFGRVGGLAYMHKLNY